MLFEVSGLCEECEEVFTDEIDVEELSTAMSFITRLKDHECKEEEDDGSK